MQENFNLCTQWVIEKLVDKNSNSKKDFEIGDLVQKWDTSHKMKGKHTKFQHSLDPFQIYEKVGLSTYIV